LDSTKKEVDRFIEASLINNYKTIDSIESEIKNIPSKIDVKRIYSENETKLKEIIASKNYEEGLRVCNLKGQVINGLGNTLIANYKEMSLKRVSNSEGSQELIRTKYFKELMIEIENN